MSAQSPSTAAQPALGQSAAAKPAAALVDALVACKLPADTGAAFQEPWQARLFAITLALHEAGHFRWDEWAQALSQAIRRAQADGDADLGDTYWLHWLSALEQMLRDRELAAPLQLAGLREALRAYARVAPSASLLRSD